jgi:hypothetical protein
MSPLVWKSVNQVSSRASGKVSSKVSSRAKWLGGETTLSPFRPLPPVRLRQHTQISHPRLEIATAWSRNN